MIDFKRTFLHPRFFYETTLNNIGRGPESHFLIAAVPFKRVSSRRVTGVGIKVEKVSSFIGCDALFIAYIFLLCVCVCVCTRASVCVCIVCMPLSMSVCMVFL